MNRARSDPRLSEYGLTTQEVAALRASGKDEWYHNEVLEVLPKDITVSRVIRDRALSFGNGPQYQLSRIDGQSPIDLQVTGDVAVDAIEPWNEAEIEQSMKEARKMLMKDPNFSIGFVPVVSQKTKPVIAKTPKSPLPDSQSQFDSPSDGTNGSEPSNSGPKLESSFKYQPKMLQRKRTHSPSPEKEQKHPRINSLDAPITPADKRGKSFVPSLPTPDESRQSSPLIRLERSKECQHLCTESRTWLLMFVLIKSYNGRSNPRLSSQL